MIWPAQSRKNELSCEVSFRVRRHEDDSETNFNLAFTTAVVMAMVSDAPVRKMQTEVRLKFLLNCSGCHGTDAKGSGPQSAKLHMKPVDFDI
jgi:cytochrome c553